MERPGFSIYRYDERKADESKLAQKTRKELKILTGWPNYELLINQFQLVEDALHTYMARDDSHEIDELLRRKTDTARRHVSEHDRLAREIVTHFRTAETRPVRGICYGVALSAFWGKSKRDSYRLPDF